MKCSPSTIVRRSNLVSETIHKAGDTKDIISTIMDVDAKYAQDYINTQNVGCLIGNTQMETLKNVWGFVKYNVKYQADKPGNEQVRTPGALFTAKKGDCKSFSIALVSILRALGFEGIRYRFTAYSGKQFTHVYVVCSLGGRDVILDSVHSRFDDEVPYTNKKDIPAAKVKISGGIAQIPQVNGTFESLWKLGAVGVGIFLIYNIFQK